MPRARFVHPEMLTDADFAELSPYNRLFFIYMLTVADDAGNFPDDVRELRAQTFPHNDEVSVTDIVEFLANATERTMYVPYTLGVRTWYHIRNFHKYQHPERSVAPKHPLYPGQKYTFSYREKGKWHRRTVTADEWNMEAYTERTASVHFKVGKVGSQNLHLNLPNNQPNTPSDPGSLPSTTGSPGPPASPARKPTPLNFEIPRHFDAMQDALRLGINLNAIENLEMLEEEVRLVRSGGQSKHQWAKKKPQPQKTT